MSAQRTPAHSNGRQRIATDNKQVSDNIDETALPNPIIGLCNWVGLGVDMGDIEIEFIPAYSPEVESVLRATMSDRGDDEAVRDAAADADELSIREMGTDT